MKHLYKLQLNWTGNTGSGTQNYKNYERSYTINIDNKPIIEGSSDPAFRGDTSKYNPEELFVASISSCHMLWYLHLCSEAKIVVTSYTDSAVGTMTEYPDGSGQFTSVTLYPKVIIANPDKIEQANKLHKAANQKCFIANSCNFQIQHFAECISVQSENKL